jgi:hypothetical protein
MNQAHEADDPRSQDARRRELSTRRFRVVVVARGHPHLLAEVEAMFRDDPLVHVIEDRRRDGTLLPRREAAAVESCSS